MNRLLATLAAVAFALPVVAMVAWSAVSQESASAFADANGFPLADQAASAGLDVQRWTARPASLSHDESIDADSTVLVVLNPGVAFTEADAVAVEGFVGRGGTLLVADDVGESNSLLASFGLRIERVRLVETHPEWTLGAAGPGDPVLAAPTPTAVAFAPGSAALVLAASSADSFLDRDGDGLIGAGDPRGPFPVAVSLPWKEGHVVVVGDADALFGPAAASNGAWITALLADVTTPGGLFLVEESARVDDPMLDGLAWARSVSASMAGRIALGVVGAAALAGLATHQAWDHWRPHRFDPLRFIRRDEVGGARPAPAFRNHWTPRGGVGIAASVALATLFLWSGSADAAIGAGIALAAVAVGLLPQAPWIQAKRTLSAERVQEGTRLDFELTLRRPFGHGEVEVQDRLPPEFEVVQGSPWFRFVPKARPHAVRYAAVPAVRGLHPVGSLFARRSDLLGLRMAEGVMLAPAQVEVTPRLEDVRRMPFGTRAPTITLGPHRVSRAGDGSEFHALRTYQAGDPFRSVNWKASARTRDLMVNQRVHESRTRLAVFLDARRVAGAGLAAQTPLVQSCRTVLAVASASLRVRDQIRLVTYGTGVQDMPVRPAGRQLHELREILSRIEPRGSTPLREAVAQVVASLKPGTPVLVASSLEGDADAPEVIMQLRARGLLPVLVSPRAATGPSDPAAGRGEADAQAIEERRRETLSRVRAAGIPTYDMAGKIPISELFRTGGAA